MELADAVIHYGPSFSEVMRPVWLINHSFALLPGCYPSLAPIFFARLANDMFFQSSFLHRDLFFFAADHALSYDTYTIAIVRVRLALQSQSVFWTAV